MIIFDNYFIEINTFKMKTKYTILILGLIITESSLGFSSIDKIELNRNLSIENLVQNQYPVIGRTRNQFGQNYSINLRVTGSSNYFGNTISYVEYNDGNSWLRIQHNMVFGQGGVYYVSINYQNYYFEF